MNLLSSNDDDIFSYDGAPDKCMLSFTVKNISY